MPSDAATPDAPKPKRPLTLRPVRRPYAHAVDAARALCGPLRMCDPGDIDVEALAHLAGADFLLSHPRVQGEGHTLRASGGAWGLVAIAQSIWWTRHGRFVLAHEIGHLLLHAGYDVLSACLESGAQLAPGARKIEGEASDAGCEILMPEAWFAPGCRGAAPGGNELRAMAERFDVDVAAAALRALLYVEVPCAMVVAKGGVVDWVACSEGWDLYLRRKAALPEASAAARVVNGGRLDARGGGVECDANVWGGRRESEGKSDEAPAIVGSVREYVHRDERTGAVIAWLVRGDRPPAAAVLAAGGPTC
jgi:IrrE N-terminal-like domain